MLQLHRIPLEKKINKNKRKTENQKSKHRFVINKQEQDMQIDV